MLYNYNIKIRNKTIFLSGGQHMNLIKETKTYEVNTKPEAEDKIKEVEEASNGTVTYKLSYKTKKVKGEIADEWYLIEITQAYDTRY